MKSTKIVFYVNNKWSCSASETDIRGFGETPCAASKDYDDKVFMANFRADLIDRDLIDSLFTGDFA